MIEIALYIVGTYLMIMTGVCILTVSRAIDEMRYVVQNKSVLSHPETWQEKWFRGLLRQAHRSGRLPFALKLQAVLAHLWQCYVYPWQVFQGVFKEGRLVLPLARHVVRLKMLQQIETTFEETKEVFEEATEN